MIEKVVTVTVLLIMQFNIFFGIYAYVPQKQQSSHLQKFQRKQRRGMYISNHNIVQNHQSLMVQHFGQQKLSIKKVDVTINMASSSSISAPTEGDGQISLESTGIDTTIDDRIPEQRAGWIKQIRQKIVQLRQSIGSLYSRNKNDDGLTFRQRLAKMGLATILSYGFVSNMSYAVTVSCAWYIHNIQTKCSPLLPGQWKQFLIVYSGFWIFNNIVRPIRLALSIGIVAPQFDRVLNYIQNKFNVSRTIAIAITVFMANVVGTISAMSVGIVIASMLSGVPIFP
jgi:hypothetical protein